LTYKAKLRGQKVDLFDERGTTRTCSQRAHVHKQGTAPAVRAFVGES
jgi:hypothetical protein